MKTTKKLLALLLALCCISSTIIPSYAAEAQPMSETTYIATALLSINSSGQALCTAIVNAKTDSYHVEATMSLNQINGNTPLKSWPLSGTGRIYEAKTYYVAKGYDYQVTVDLTVRDFSGNLIESIIVSSSIVHY